MHIHSQSWFKTILLTKVDLYMFPFMFNSWLREMCWEIKGKNNNNNKINVLVGFEG